MTCCVFLSGNCRAGAERHFRVLRQVPEIAEVSRMGFHSWFGFFRRLAKRISPTTTGPSAHFGDGHY